MNYKRLSFRGKHIHYGLQGEGYPVVFIHGFLLSSQIVGAFGNQLAGKYRLITIDLPGHGLSDSYAPDHSMECMADTVNAVLKEERVEAYALVGHSMGGYVALALWERYPENLESVILMNSHPFADSQERKRERERINALIRKGKKDLFIREVLREALSAPGLLKSGLQTELLSSALHQDEDSLIATSNGMMERTERSHLLRDPGIPFRWLAGRFDTLHPYQQLVQQARQRNIILPESIDTGHMSFLEDPVGMAQIISGMIADQHTS